MQEGRCLRLSDGPVLFHKWCVGVTSTTVEGSKILLAVSSDQSVKVLAPSDTMFEPHDWFERDPDSLEVWIVHCKEMVTTDFFFILLSGRRYELVGVY